MRSAQVSVLRDGPFKAYGQNNTMTTMHSTARTVKSLVRSSVIHKYLCVTLLATLVVGRIYNLTQHFITARNYSNFSKVTWPFHFCQFQLDTMTIMSLSTLKRHLPLSLACLLFYGSASRFTHGTTSTSSFYQYQNDRSPDDGSTTSRVIPVCDLIIGVAILRGGLSQKIATCFVASTIGCVAVQRLFAGLDCQGDFFQAVWATATAVVILKDH